jgi:hypothetical protein
VGLRYLGIRGFFKVLFLFPLFAVNVWAIEDDRIMVSTIDIGREKAVENIKELSLDSFEKSITSASLDLGKMVNEAAKASERLPKDFRLQEIEVEFGISASGGFLIYGAGAEGGIVLHFSKREDERQQ